jgi:hypothetical protein
LKDPQRVSQMAEKNYQLALEHFSLQVLETKLKELIANLG